MRTYTEYYSPVAGLLLDKLTADNNVSSDEYRDAFYSIGKELAATINRTIPELGQSTMLACASEDADWLAKGLLDGFSNVNTALAVFWNDRNVFPDNKDIVFSPIVKSYIEDIERCQTLIIVKSIIVSSCVVKTQLTRLIGEINPERIIIASPVMYKDSEQNLMNEFPREISDKFIFIPFAVDDSINENGEVVPGIGGMVYTRLGLGNVHLKKKYVPEIVKQRRIL